MDLPPTIGPIPGDPAAIRRRASQYAATADAILDAISGLRTAIAETRNHDSEALDVLAENAGSVTDKLATLENAATDSSSLASVIPVHELSNAVEDFAGKWDDTRRGLIEEVSALREQAAAVAQAFTDVDIQLADALTRPPQPEAAPAVPGGHGGPTAY